MPEPYEGFDLLYADVEFQGEIHRRAHELVDGAFDDFVKHRQGHAPPTHDEAATFEARTERQAEIVKLYLMLAVKNVSEWRDNLEFHDMGVRSTDLLKRVLDWFSENPKLREAAEAAGVFVADPATNAAARMETEMCGVFRTFIRKCRPVVLRRGYHRFMLINTPDGGIALGTNGHGDRDILAWCPGERLN